jgi:periplasmic divalent cation tolerance protein
MKLVALYSTFPNLEAAERAARILVEEGRVACANLFPGVVSLYRWQGALQRDTEVALVAKTTGEGVAAAAARLRALHPYELPCLTWGEVAGADPAYAHWVRAQTAAQD